MSLDPRVHKLTLALGVLGILLANYIPLIPPGFWTQFAVATYAVISPLVSFIKTGQAPPMKEPK